MELLCTCPIMTKMRIRVLPCRCLTNSPLLQSRSRRTPLPRIPKRDKRKELTRKRRNQPKTKIAAKNLQKIMTLKKSLQKIIFPKKSRQKAMILKRGSPRRIFPPVKEPQRIMPLWKGELHQLRQRTKKRRRLAKAGSPRRKYLHWQTSLTLPRRRSLPQSPAAMRDRGGTALWKSRQPLPLRHGSRNSRKEASAHPSSPYRSSRYCR